MPDLIGRQLGQYEITGLIGRGSIAAVYQAHPAGTAGVVAVKVIETRQARDPEFVRRFRREAEAVAVLSHPNIVRLFDFGQQDDLLYLVMELMPGGSLAQRIRERSLTGPRAARYLDQIARALDYAHGESIIHRDLRPENVLFDGQGNAILTDFGIAPLMTTGAPAYMAPEQWQSRDVDGRADLYALGCMVYEMLAGQTPFTGDTAQELMQAHVSQPAPSIHALRPDLPKSVEIVLEKALAKGREARFQSGSAFAEAFRTALRGRVPAWLDVGVPPDAASVAADFPRSRRRASRRSSRRTASVSVDSTNNSRRIGLLTIGLVAMIGVAAIVVLVLASRGRNGANTPPTTTLQLAVAPSLTWTPSHAPQSPTAVLAATSTLKASSTPGSTPSLTPSVAPTESETPDIPATVARIVAMTDTAAATLASPTPPITASLTASPTPSATETALPSPTSGPTVTGTETPDIPATVAHIVGQTNTAVALAASPTPTITSSHTPSATFTNTPTLTPSLTPSRTPTATASATPSITPTGTLTPDIPATVARIVAMTDTAAATLATRTPTFTPSFTASTTWTPTLTTTPSVTASLTQTPTATLTPSVTPTGTLTPDIPATVAHIVGMTATAAATLATPTPTIPPTFTASATPTETLTETPRTTPTDAPTATSTSETGAVAITNADFANLRAGPGTSFVRLAIATRGQAFPVTGRTAQGSWLQIILPDGRSAWVSGGLVLISPSDATIPLITPLPTVPTQTPSPTPGS